MITKHNSLGCMVHPLSFQFSKREEERDEENNKMISRIAIYDFFLENEINIYKQIQLHSCFYTFEYYEKINYHEFMQTYFSLTGSIHSHTKINTETDKSDKSKYFLLHYPNKRLYEFKEILGSFENNTHYIRFIIQCYQKLLSAIEILTHMSIIHNNISYKTICFDKYKEPLLFKFDVSMYIIPENINVEYIKKYLLVYNPGYQYWPLEFHMLSYLFANKMETLSKIHIDIIIDDVIKNNIILKNFDENTITKYKVNGNDFLNKYINKKLKYIVEDVFHYKNTWDNYALSILFLDILLKINQKMKTKNEFIMYFIKLLVGNIHSEPKMRLSIKDTIEQFQKICYNTDIKIFKSLISNLSL
jgi:hypothetical protein